MRRFISLDHISGLSYRGTHHSHNIQDLSRGIIPYPLIQYRPRVLQPLIDITFQFGPSRNLVSEGEHADQCLSTFWRGDNTSQKSQDTVSITISMDTDSRPSNTSLHSLAQERGHGLITTAQQTDVTYPIDSVELNTSTAELQADQSTHAEESSTISLQDPPIAIPGQVSMLGSVRALLLQKYAQQQNSGKNLNNTSCSFNVPDTICRICFGGESAERLVRPCSCRGTIASVHRSCLERWLLQAATSYCELCRYHYDVTRTHKWSFLRSMMEWARSWRGRALASDVWRGAALGVASALCTSRALHACDHLLQVGAVGGGYMALGANITSSVLIGLIGAINGLLTTWMLLKIQEHQMSWQNWRDSTLHVRVTLIPAAESDVQELTGDSAPPPAQLAQVGSDSTVVADGANLDEFESSVGYADW